MSRNFTNINTKLATFESSFDILSTGYKGKRDEDYIPDFRFVVHVASGSSYVKFDTGLSSMTWNPDAVGYVLCYKLMMKADKEDTERDATGTKVKKGRTRTRVDFGQRAFVNPDATATDSSGAQVNVTMDSETHGSPHACTMYGKFTRTLNHDPLLGVDVPDLEDTAIAISAASAAFRPFPCLIWTLMVAFLDPVVRWG